MKIKPHLFLSKVRLTGACVGLLLLACASDARAWWNSDWTIRKKITVDTSTSGAPISKPIGTTPILIRLHDGNFRFTDAKEDGSDIRFVAADDKTLLTYHIEKYDSLLNEAFVWVKVPDLKPGAKTSFWLYYGNAGSRAVRVDNPKETYDVNTALVYHFAGSGPPQDSTGYHNNAQNAAIPVAGSLIGPGIRFDGTNPITIPNSESLTWKDGAAVTWSAWIKPIAKQPNTILFSRRDGGNAFVIGLDNGVPFAEVSGAGGTQRTKGTPTIPPNTWHHLAVTAAGSEIDLYLDGKSVATLAAALPPLSSALSLGGDSSGGTGFVGELDELEISKAARPAGFIEIAARSQGTNTASKLLTFGADDVKTSWFSGGYIGVILRSLTVDGWAVICILVVMSAISWVVMVNKAKYLKATINGNKQFFQDWKDVAADLSFLDERDARKVLTLGGRIDNRERQAVKSASVYRIYKIGAEEIRHRLLVEGGAAESHLLSARSIHAIRAMLDGALVKEGQKLNRLMVLLTIAISGGPFLGLLGTVIGVMITFAAIAAQGDVNVNAIAPGIAAALAATVAGLFVAIPALFGYNYLLSQVKDATSDMHIFIDEFVTKIAEYYGGSPNGQHNRSGEDVEMEMIA
jgi:biopolymer transport protein ExbB